LTISTIHTFLVRPHKGIEGELAINGDKLPHEGGLFRTLSDIFKKSDTECNIEIAFNHREDGTQENQVKNDIASYAIDPSIKSARKVAERLARATTNRSGLGLLFLILGSDKGKKRLVLSRFPTNNAILAEENKDRLNVQFLERVFMRSTFSYKAAAYEAADPATGFWQGRAVDKQINTSDGQVSRYWIEDFLDSQLLTTSLLGSKRLADALRMAIGATADPETKQELAAVAMLARGQNNKTRSVRQFAEKVGLSADGKTALYSKFRNSALLDEQFQFDLTEFRKHVGFRSRELDNGAIITAIADRFDQIYETTKLKEGNGRVRISTEGTVVNDKLRKSTH